MAFPRTVNLDYGDEKKESSSAIGNLSVGTRGVTPDGRVFYYAKNSSAAITTGGMIVDGIAAVAAHDMDVASTATSVGGLTVTSGTSLTVTKNQYQDGYIIFNDGPGEGEVYRIASNSAVSGATGLTVTVTDPGGFRTALTTASLFGLIYNPYTDVKIIDGDGTMTTGPLGITTIPVTASYYCWLLTSGPGSVAIGAAVGVVGDGLQASQASGEDGRAALFDVSANTDLVSIGTAIGIPSVDTDKQLAMINIRS